MREKKKVKMWWIASSSRPGEFVGWDLISLYVERLALIYSKLITQTKNIIKLIIPVGID